MAKYEIIYDYHDDWGKQTLREEADTYEEAKQIFDDLRASDDCDNIQIIDMNFE